MKAQKKKTKKVAKMTPYEKESLKLQGKQLKYTMLTLIATVISCIISVALK